MLTIDEAIKHCEEVATENEKSIAYYTIQGDKEWLDECEKDCIECAKEHRQLAKWLRELKAYREKPMYLWFPINRKLPSQYQHVIAILRSGAEVETYLAHEMWHIVDGVRVNFGDVVFWRYMEVNADGKKDSN